jgi:hypothetical protein
MDDRRVAKTYERGTEVHLEAECGSRDTQACTLSRGAPALLVPAADGLFHAEGDALRGTPNRDSIFPVSEREALKVLPMRRKRFAMVSGEPTYPAPSGPPHGTDKHSGASQRPSQSGTPVATLLTPLATLLRSTERGKSHRVLSGGKKHRVSRERA